MDTVRMTGIAGVSAQGLVRWLRRRGAALPSEIGTFMVFEACEAMIEAAPTRVTLESMWVSEDGLLALTEEETAGEGEAARDLHRVLASLLVAAGPPPTPALLRLVEEGPTGAVWTLVQMRDDLEAALVPLNRTASRRVLARLVRETTRGELPAWRPEPVSSFDELDDELNELLHLAPDSPSREPRAAAGASRAPGRPESSGEGQADALDAKTSIFSRSAPSNAPPSSAPPGPPLRDLGALAEYGGDPDAPSSHRGWLGVVLIVLAALLVALVLALRPGLIRRWWGGDPGVRKAASGPAAVSARAATLVIRVSPERAHVMRLVGRGPATVSRLPVGVAHEFVALSDSRASARVVVPASAKWEGTPTGLRYEVAMQTGAPPEAGADLDLGTTLLTQDMGTANGGQGSIRIVTTPPGAKVYQVVGFGPEAYVEGLAPDEPQELLVWAKGYEPLLRTVRAGDYVDRAGARVAELAITLAPRASRPGSKK